MNFTIADIASQELAVIEATLVKYIATAQLAWDSGVSISPEFEDEINWLIATAKAKGSTIDW